MTLEEKTSPNLEQYRKTYREFEDWYNAKNLGANKAGWLPINILPFEMQQGVYLSFLREKKVHLIPQVFPGLEYRFEDMNDPDWSNRLPMGYNTALIAAIEAGFSRLETPSA